MNDTHLSFLANSNLPPLSINNLNNSTSNQRPSGPRILKAMSIQRMRSDAPTALRHAIPLLEASARELLFQQLQHLGRDGRSARGEAFDAGQVVVGNDGVAHQADQERGHHLDLGDAVSADGGEEGRHREGGEDDDACRNNKREGEEFEDPSY